MKLKQDYKKIKDHNNQSGADRKTGKWYETLDLILGHRPAYGNAKTKTPLLRFCGRENNPPSQLLEEQNRSLLSNPIPVACSTLCRPSETPMALSSNPMPPLSDKCQPASENIVVMSCHSLPPQSASTSQFTYIRFTNNQPTPPSCQHPLPSQTCKKEKE
ncbi:uncharacterized protein LOC130930419 isoform X2 [Corythoichthys intestinalis]|uniref:uncharacterized protein LOC130930419 isoform X2 n=1 Tax=Corythoichthys intestinalis TaxID=161448 RepID=UPI0025A51A22|nr:uncharacterized protein LOC130930419 isoform X2 [Corythoichthys intestinalis]